MKALKCTVLCSIFVSSLAWFGVWYVQAKSPKSPLPKTSGYLCWQYQDVGHNGESYVLRYYVKNEGNGYYTLRGLNTFADVTNHSSFGSLVVDGSNAVATIHAAYVASWGKSAGTAQLNLDSTTLNGSCFSLAHEYGDCDGTGETNQHCLAYYYATLTLVSCP